MKCKHCKERPAHTSRRYLCWRCSNTPSVLKLYPSKMKAALDTVKRVNRTPVKQLIRKMDKHPLWRGSPLRSDDPRYVELFMAREAAGLPGRHPDDARPNLD